MAKSKCKMTFSGYDELINDIKKMGGDFPRIITEAVELSGNHATARYEKMIQKHHFSGLTEASLIQNPKAENDGKKITLQTGFDISKGGTPAIWLDRGTPKQKPLNFIKTIKRDKVVTGSIGYMLKEELRRLNGR